MNEPQRRKKSAKNGWWERNGLSIPEILRPAKLVNQRTDKDEQTLEKEAVAGPRRTFAGNNVVTKQDPAAGDDRAKAEHEADEEPDPGAGHAHATVRVPVAAHLAVGHGVDHHERQRAHDPADVEAVEKLILRSEKRKKKKKKKNTMYSLGTRDATKKTITID
jgi:hypothetical protein